MSEDERVKVAVGNLLEPLVYVVVSSNAGTLPHSGFSQADRDINMNNVMRKIRFVMDKPAAGQSA
jgi:hypothetical protein